jgi:hypothetical protein
MSRLKTFLFTLITLGLMAVVIEGGLSALHYQMNDRKWAVERAFDEAAAIWEREVSKSLSRWAASSRMPTIPPTSSARIRR